VTTGITDREPVALAGAIQGLLTAVGSVLVVFDVWDPTEDQLAALGVLFTAAVGVLTVMARSKAWSPASVQLVKADDADALGRSLDERAALLKVVEQVTAPKPSPPFLPQDVVERIAEPPPPAPQWTTVAEHRAAREAAGLNG
jgi:hypothetical protein